jgi:hypothetical protein
VDVGEQNGFQSVSAIRWDGDRTENSKDLQCLDPNEKDNKTNKLASNTSELEAPKSSKNLQDGARQL